MKKMIFIHTALLCEAQPIIEKLKLKKTTSHLYHNEKTILLISGIGAKNTEKYLEKILPSHSIKIAINIGIAGCSDKNIPIGKLFCVNKDFNHIPQASITSANKASKNIKTILADMEAKSFIKMCEKFDIKYLIFKVVSDHLDPKIPKKSFVSKLIRESLDKWINLI